MITSYTTGDDLQNLEAIERKRASSTAQKTNAPQVAACEALKVNQLSNNQSDMNINAIINNLPCEMTVLLAGHPVRVLNRYNETWLVASDVMAAIGVKSDRIRHWNDIPEMERDVDWFRTKDGQVHTLKIVTAQGLPELLKKRPPGIAAKVVAWAQASVSLATA